MRKHCGRRLVLVLLLCLLHSQPAVAEVTVTQTNFGTDTWLRQTDDIRLRIDRLPGPEEGELAILIGDLDVTSQVRMVGGELTYTPAIIPLPSGESELVVYLVSSPEEWNEIGRFPLKVLTRMGFEQAEVDPRLDLNFESRLVESRNDEAGPSDRSSLYGDLQLQGGVDTQHERSGVDVKTSWDLLGSTRQKDALRFSQQQNSAPKLDLSSYLVDTTMAGFNLSVGHVQYGNNRHLLNSVSNRGITLSRKLGDRFDISFNAMNGRSIVGYDNFLGMSDISDNSYTSGTFGIHLLQNQFADVRFEGMLMRGRIKPRVSFNFGEVVDAEESKGFGMRLFGNVWEDRVHGDFSFARSSFDNPNDGGLSLGGVNLVDVKKVTDNARYFELSVDLLRNINITENKFFSLSISGSHERIDPQYKSLGAFTNTNQEINELAATGYAGDVSYQFQHVWTKDNLDDLDNILTTKTRNAMFNLGLPLNSLFSNPGFEKWWLPSINYGFNWTHQFGANSPSFEDSGFEASSIPDQLDVMNTIGTNWSGDLWDWSFGYQFMQSFQDNRQDGREDADFTNLMNMFTLSLRPHETLNLNIGMGWTTAGNEEQNLDRYTYTTSLGFEWAFWQDWMLSGTYSYTDEDDSADQAINRSYTLNTQLRGSLKSQARRAKRFRVGSISGMHCSRTSAKIGYLFLHQTVRSGRSIQV